MFMVFDPDQVCKISLFFPGLMVWCDILVSSLLAFFSFYWRPGILALFRAWQLFEYESTKLDVPSLLMVFLIMEIYLHRRIQNPYLGSLSTCATPYAVTKCTIHFPIFTPLYVSFGLPEMSSNLTSLVNLYFSLKAQCKYPFPWEAASDPCKQFQPPHKPMLGCSDLC